MGKPGRPRLADTEIRTRVEVRLDPKTAAELAALEDHYRTSPSAVVRLAIARLAEAEGKEAA
jgi:hypothetical protein